METEGILADFMTFTYKKAIIMGSSAAPIDSIIDGWVVGAVVCLKANRAVFI